MSAWLSMLMITSDPGLVLTERIKEAYLPPNTALYTETKDGKDPAFNWSVGVWLSALNAAAERDPKWKAELTRYADATRVYWNDAPPVAGYNVWPVPKPTDRYYDDNAWMVMSLVETYEVTGEKKYLGWADDAMRYVLSGMDDTLGGGIYWRESDRGASKNTCSNGPSASALLALYAHTKKPEDLKTAREVYDWTYRTLRDPEDGLMWDAITKDGDLQKYKWSYNTALILRAALELYRFTKEERYAKEADHFARASLKHWYDPQTGEMRCEGKFAHLLLENWARAVELRPLLRDELAPAITRVQERLAANAATGWYGHRWDGLSKLPDSPMLIDQAAAARALLIRVP